MACKYWDVTVSRVYTPESHPHPLCRARAAAPATCNLRRPWVVAPPLHQPSTPGQSCCRSSARTHQPPLLHFVALHVALLLHFQKLTNLLKTGPFMNLLHLLHIESPRVGGESFWLRRCTHSRVLHLFTLFYTFLRFDDVPVPWPFQTKPDHSRPIQTNPDYEFRTGRRLK